MRKIFIERISAILLFLLLIVGAVFCLLRLSEDISSGRYFSRAGEIHYDIIYITTYVLIILFALRYGYYLALDRVNWKIIKDDFLFLLNKKYFSKVQWIINVLLFWLSFVSFIISLSISTLKGNF